MKILVICASRRERSLTRRLTDIAFAYAKSKHEGVKYLDFGKTEMEPFRGYADTEYKYTRATMDIVKTVESSDVFIIGTPIYDAVFASALKNLFEFVDYKASEGKVAGFIVKGASAGAHQLVRSQLVSMMNYFSILSNPRAVFATNADFDESGNLKNHDIEQRIALLVDSTAKMRRE